MNLTKKFTALFRRPGPVLPEARIDGILEDERRRIVSVDPDTGRQWNLLRAALPAASPDASPARTLRHRPVLRPALAYGAAAVGLAVVVMLLWQRDPAVISYETPRGRQSTITLADSSQVVLNHTTRLQVQGAGADEPRLLTLDGEAFFRVRHTGRPFVVKTVSGSVEVLGTEFNVRVRHSMLELTVLRGRVRLADGRESVVVDAGRVAVCAPGAAPVLSDRTAPAGEPGWMSGRFTFDRTSLADACREFEVYFDTRIHVADPVLRSRTITGTVQATRADAAITTLARLTGTNVRHEESGYTLF